MKKVGKIKTTKSANSRSTRRSVFDAVNTDVKGIGSYASQNMTKGGLFGSNKSAKGLTRRQIYNLEKMAQKSQQMAISSKPEMIRALGQSLAMNTTGVQGGVATGLANKISNNNNNNNNNSSITSLVGGGARVAGKDNEEEEKVSSFSDLPEYVAR